MHFVKTKISLLLSFVIIFLNIVSIVPVSADVPGNPLIWDFDDGTASGWTVSSGQWSVNPVTGTYNQTNIHGSSTITSVGEYDWSNYSVEADIKATSRETYGGKWGFGLVLGLTDPSTSRYLLYFAHYNDARNRDVITLGVRNGSPTSTWYDYTPANLPPLELNRTYHFMAVMTDDYLEVYIDNEKMATINLPAEHKIEAGKIGLTTEFCVVEFDNIVVKSPPETPDVIPTPIPSSPPPDGILLEDNFDDGNADGWEISSGAWTVNQTIKAYQSPRDWVAATIAGQANWSNYSIEAEAKVLEKNPLGSGMQNASFGFYTAYGNDNTRYSFAYCDWYGAEYSSSYIINKRINESSSTEIQRVNGAPEFETGKTYHIKAVMSDTKLEFYVDGIKAAEGSIDSGLKSGKIGLHTNNCKVEFDNIIVKSPPGIEPTPTPSPKPSLPPAPVINYSTDFSNGAGDWTVESGNWSIDTEAFGGDKALKHTGGGLGVISIGNEDWRSYTAEVEVRVLKRHSGMGANRIGFMTGYRDPDNRYLMWQGVYDNGTANKVLIEKKFDGNTLIEVEKPGGVSLDLNKSYNLK